MQSGNGIRLRFSSITLNTFVQKQPPRQYFKISVLIFQEIYLFVKQTSFFPGSSICSSNRHVFFQEVLSVRQTDIFFPGGSIFSLNGHDFSRRVYLFVEQTFYLHRTDINLSRNPYSVLEHIRIFQEPLFSHRTDINFPGASVSSSNSSNRYSFSKKPYLVLKHIRFSRRPLCLEQIGNFQEGTPRRTDISLRSWWLLLFVNSKKLC